MKSFITKLLCFILLYFAVSIVISVFIPYHWGNPWYSTKVQYLEKNNQLAYNTFFFGSSRVYRQLDPELFDSVFNSFSQEKVSSFNLGAPSTFNPQSYFLYEHFLNSDLSNNAKYCFLELREVSLSGNLMHEERTTYWQNFTDLLFIGKSIYANDQIGFIQKTKTGLNYSMSYFENLFHLGHFGQQLISPDYYDDRYLGPHKNGFFSLDKDYETNTDEKIKEDFKKRKNSFRNNAYLFNNRKSQLLNSYNTISNSYDEVNLKRILALIEQSKQKGIELIFILSPGNASQESINLSTHIPEMNIIDLANPKKYGFLYNLDNLFDKGHLNSKGATAYSKMLAFVFAKKGATAPQFVKLQ